VGAKSSPIRAQHHRELKESKLGSLHASLGIS
jgi:hypothetical protein